MLDSKHTDMSVHLCLSVITVHYPDPSSIARNLFPQLLGILATETYSWSLSGNCPGELPSTKGSCHAPRMCILPQEQFKSNDCKTKAILPQSSIDSTSPCLGLPFSLPSRVENILFNLMNYLPRVQSMYAEERIQIQIHLTLIPRILPTLPISWLWLAKYKFLPLKQDTHSPSLFDHLF